MRAPSSRVLELPELVSLICNYSETADLVKLLRVSRNLFHCVAPLIWRDLDGVTKLLDLIPVLDSDRLELVSPGTDGFNSDTNLSLRYY